MDSSNSLALTDLCRELGLQDRFVLDLAGSAEEHTYYESYRIPKKSGGIRYINASQGRLKRIQRLILDAILSRFPMPSHVHGCVKGRSIVTNASSHVGKKVVVNIDLSDFFRTITKEHVKEIFKSKFQFDDETSIILSNLTTFRGDLPIGAPSSPALANLAALELDEAIMRICNEKIQNSEYGYSRYVDDITVSGADDIVELLPSIYEAIEKCGFKRNMDKTRILRRSTRQWVTGVVVNQKVNAPRKIVRKIRQALYYCKKWGVGEHCEARGLDKAKFMQQIIGYIAFLRLTQPELADQFFVRFRELWDFQDPKTDKIGSAIARLKNMIDDQEIVYFVYADIRRSVAPVSLEVDADGSLVLRGFEFAPNKG
jgi:RNA-directed DNA polymerase